ncbi:vanadium-dependent haloperoxidase [Sphingomonas sp.]|jgi:hypothetical protein|uniref:vanadium-dependent haloperoxidase n=1 Tax=Sphingomonas sp. TaxID=28214 RepID=UPI002DF59D3A|nr:vanadium-dependent haloperoxidase [Sphingomonas sp.]
MKTKWLLVAATASVLATPAQADMATNWWEVANRFYLAGQVSSAPRTPDMERASARTALAMFEAANAIGRRYESHLKLPAADAKASPDAAVATAAFKVLVHHYPANKTILEESYAMVMAAIPEGPAKLTGVAIGEAAAAAAIPANGIDPALEQTSYRPRAAPGEWIGGALPTLDPHWFALKPWMGKMVESLMPPPPPALTSETWARDLAEVQRLGARASKDRTPYQTLIARYRQGYDLSPMVRTIADQPGRTLLDNARMLALYQMAMDDAVQVMAIAKLRYDFWRPITAIRNADRDGNDATQRDPAWVPLLPTPNFPEYPCGHCTAVAVQTEVLKLVGGMPASTPVRVAAGGSPNMVVQSVKSWDELVRQVSDSRMLGGVHHRFSNDAGEEIGRRAARTAVSTLLRPIGKR